MKPIALRKTVLALAISAAALPAFADTFSLSNGRIQLTGQQYSAPVLINGTYDPAPDLNRLDAVDLVGSEFHDGLVFDATIQVGSSSDDLVYDNADAVELDGSIVHGDLVNKGSLKVERLFAMGMNIDGSTLWANLVNQGSIQAKGAPHQFSGEAEQVATGIGITESQVWDLINDGSIKAEGLRAKGLAILDSDIDGIINNGTITAIGSGSIGVHLDDARLWSLENNGTIQADGIAIVVDNATQELYIEHHAGLISGGNAAIQGNGNQVGLYWDGGRIKGDILGLGDYATVAGNAEFDGARIETSEWLEVDGGSQAASLELLQAHTVVDGKLYVASNGTLGLGLGSTTQAATPVLQVTGIAEFDAGSQVRLTARNSDFSANAADYVLVQAGTLTDYGLSVTSTSSLLNVDTFAVNGNQLVARVTTRNQQQVAQQIAASGGSGNAQAAGGAFSQLVVNHLAQSNPDDPVRQAFIDASSDPAALARLAEQLAPEVSGGATQAAVGGQALVNNATGNRTGSGRQGLSSGDALAHTGAWVQALYSDADQDLRDGVAGYNAHSRGIAVGADGKLGEQLTLGLAYSFINTDVNGEIGNSTEVDSHALTFYSGFEQGDFFADASLSYGINDNSGKRDIAGTTAKSDYDSTLLGLNLLAGYSLHPTPGLLVEPRVAARYSRVDIDGYREKGSSAALAVDEQRFEVGEVGAGLRLASSLPLGQGTLEPQATLMAYHDFIADQAASTSSFVLGGTPFITSGASPARTSYEAGIGVDYHLGAVTLGASYDYLGKDDFNADTFSARVRYDF